MGSKHGKLPPTLKKKELQEFAQTTHFTQEEIEKLYERFKNISESIDSDGVIDINEFQQALGLTDSVFARRIFSVFDRNGDRVINFKEFVHGLSVFCSKSTPEEKIKFSFKIYDVDGDGTIDKNELYEMLKASLFEKNMFNLTETQMRALIDHTFAQADANGDGRISFEEYKTMVMKHPSILKNLTINTTLLTS